jgi:hypothetical protein
MAQIIEIYKNKTTGNLSFITYFLNFGGMAARLFTIWAELSDNLLFLVIFKMILDREYYPIYNKWIYCNSIFYILEIK